MILQALTAYYEQLLKQGKVEAPGWDSRFKVSYELRLGPFCCVSYSATLSAVVSSI